MDLEFVCLTCFQITQTKIQHLIIDLEKLSFKLASFEMQVTPVNYVGKFLEPNLPV